MSQVDGGPIVLVGLPASGKSTIGAKLARRLGVEFVDVDTRIEADAGQTIAEIFTAEGETGFRQRELDTTLELLERPGVLALGGGAVVTAQLREALQAHRVVWLQVGLTDAVRRVGNDRSRPLLAGSVRDSLRRLAREREPLYREVASIQINTSRQTSGRIIRQIMEELELADAHD